MNFLSLSFTYTLERKELTRDRACTGAILSTFPDMRGHLGMDFLPTLRFYFKFRSIPLVTNVLDSGSCGVNPPQTVNP